MHLASVLRVNAYRPKGGTRPADGEIDSFELIFAPPAGFAGFQFGRRIMTENTTVKVPISSVCGKGFPVTFNLLIEERTILFDVSSSQLIYNNYSSRWTSLMDESKTHYSASCVLTDLQASGSVVEHEDKMWKN